MANASKGLSISPQRMGNQVLSQYQKDGFQNNVIALKVQLALHSVFIHQNYKLLPERLRIRLRRLQSLAFDGFYPSPDDLSEIIQMLSPLDEENCTFIRTALELSMTEINTALTQESAWTHLSDDPGENRTLTDARAVRHFAQLFRYRLLVWGSARCEPNSPDFDGARWLSESIISHTATNTGETEAVLTGAGPGIMDAANIGALRARWKLINPNADIDDQERETQREKIRARIMSCGLRIMLPHEPGWNNHLQTNLTIKQFPLRKFGMVMCATGRSNADTAPDGIAYQDHYGHPAIFAFFGGFGTLDEVMDAICLKQCNKMPDIPIYLIGKTYRRLRRIFCRMADLGTSDRTDLDIADYCTHEVEAFDKYLTYYNLHNDQTRHAMHKRKPTAVR